MTFSDAKKCGAKRRDGGACGQVAMTNGRCRMHGGRTPRGLASPNTVTGRYSKDLPTRLLSRYGVALADPGLLSLRDDVALLQGLIGAKLEELQAAEATPDLEHIVHLIETIQTGWRTWNEPQLQSELARLADAVAGRQNQDVILRDIRGLLHEKAALVSQENRRLVELQQTMTVEQAILLAQALVGIVRSQLVDLPDGNERLRVISAEFRKLMSVPDQAGRA